MYFLSPTNRIIGLDISDLSIKAIQLKKKSPNNIIIKAKQSIEVGPGLISEGVINNFEAVAKIIKENIVKNKDKFNTKYAVLSLPETKTFIKLIDLPNNKKSIRETITQELPKHVPVNLDDMQMDYQHIKNIGRKNKFLIGLVPKKISEDYIKLAHMSGLEPIALEIEAQAIIRSIIKKENNAKDNFLNIFKKNSNTNKTGLKNGPRIILDMGATRTSLILFDQDTIQFSNSLSNISGELLTIEIAKKLKIDKEKAEKIKTIFGSKVKKNKQGILKTIDSLTVNIARAVKQAEEFYESHFGRSVQGLEIIICGGGANLTGVETKISKLTNRNTILADPLANINLDNNGQNDKNHKRYLEYATAIGLALRNKI